MLGGPKVENAINGTEKNSHRCSRSFSEIKI